MVLDFEQVLVVVVMRSWPVCRMPRVGRAKQSFASTTLVIFGVSFIVFLNIIMRAFVLAHYTPALLSFPAVSLRTPNIHRLRVRRRTQFLTAIHPHSLQFLFNLRPPHLPLFNLGQPFP